ncbi:MAG TPA: cupredoxin domain-containing protein [Acidimicrobiia bacterium]
MTKTVEIAEKVARPPSRTSGWVKVARIGSLTIGVWSLALQILAGEIIPPVVIIGVVFTVVAVFLKGDRRRLALVAALLALLSVGGNLPMTIDELSHPSSSIAFLLTLLATSAAAVVTVAGLAAFFGWSLDTRPAVYYSWAGVLALGVVVSVAAASGVESIAPSAGDVEVVASGVEFDPERIVVSAGETGFWLDNRDGIRHTFTIEELDLEIDTPGLSAQRADFDLAAGEYTVICSVPGHENMVIDLVVEP